MPTLMSPTTNQNMDSEPSTVTNLKGTSANPGREPRKAPKVGKGSMGDQAFMDAVVIVALAWALLLFLALSLRHHNV